MARSSCATFKPILLVLLLLPAAKAQYRQNAVTIPRGIALKLSTVQDLDSATAKPGDDVPLRLERGLIVNGVSVLQSGTVVHGTVTSVSRAGANCKYGTVEWKLDSVSLPDSSSLETEIIAILPAGLDVPQTFPNKAIRRHRHDVLRAVALSPLYVPLGLISLPSAIAMGVSDNPGGGKCTHSGTEYHLEAGMTIAASVAKNHTTYY
jgi:hypothetical protein